MPETAQTIESTPRAAVLPATFPGTAPDVERALTAIEHDSQQAPESYLADSVVPYGGE
jgi:hypothetical protein